MFISHALPYRAGIPLRTHPYFPLVPARVTLRRNAHPGKPFPTASRTTGDDRTTGLRTQCSGIFSGSAPFRPAPAFRQNRHAATFLRSQRCPQAIGFRPEIPILVSLRVVQPRERLQTPQEIGIVPFASRPSPRTGPDRKPSATAESHRKPAARSRDCPDNNRNSNSYRAS